jgi:hypothetical protein
MGPAAPERGQDRLARIAVSRHSEKAEQVPGNWKGEQDLSA